MNASSRIASALFLLIILSACAQTTSTIATDDFVRAELKKHEN